MHNTKYRRNFLLIFCFPLPTAKHQLGAMVGSVQQILIQDPLYKFCHGTELVLCFKDRNQHYDQCTMAHATHVGQTNTGAILCKLR